MIHTLINEPLNTEWQLFNDENLFLKKIIEHNKVFIDIINHTPKSFSVRLYLPGYLYSINRSIKGFKTLPDASYDLNYNQVFKYYFKILKKQGFEELKLYVEQILKDIGMKKELNVYWHKTRALNQILNK